MQNALFYPFPLLDSLSMTTASVRPFNDVSPMICPLRGLRTTRTRSSPNAAHETSRNGRSKVAYNEFGSSPRPTARPMGRMRAAKVVIFETDGVPNMHCDGALTKTTAGGPGQWYYSNRQFAMGRRESAIACDAEGLRRTDRHHKSSLWRRPILRGTPPPGNQLAFTPSRSANYSKHRRPPR